MTNAEATITENAATVAEQGAHVAPGKASSKKGATQKKGAPKGQKAAKGKAKAAPKKEAKAGKKANPAPAKETSTPRAESKGAKILESDGSDLDPEPYFLAWYNTVIRTLPLPSVHDLEKHIIYSARKWLRRHPCAIRATP
jgi:hypothetical protein